MLSINACCSFVNYVKFGVHVDVAIFARIARIIVRLVHMKSDFLDEISKGHG